MQASRPGEYMLKERPVCEVEMDASAVQAVLPELQHRPRSRLQDVRWSFTEPETSFTMTSTEQMFILV